MAGHHRHASRIVAHQIVQAPADLHGRVTIA
jgi:hypothetical protein